MSLVNIVNVATLNANATWEAPFEFEITLHVSAKLPKDVEFRVVYVGSSDSNEHDQLLESVMVGPLQVGPSKFVLSVPPPNMALVPTAEVLGVTVLMLNTYYEGREFFRMGFFVNNEVPGLKDGAAPPSNLKPSRIKRETRQADNRFVKRTQIEWPKA